MPGTEGTLKAAGTQLARIYIERQQATVAQWVALRPLFEVCTRKTGYEGGERRRKERWHQEATEKQLRTNLEDSWEAKKRRWSGADMVI